MKFILLIKCVTDVEIPGGIIFGFKCYDVIGDPRKLHKKEYHNMCSSQLLGYTIKGAKMGDKCDIRVYIYKYIRVKVLIKNSGWKIKVGQVT
jgi:hypothetical protein